MITLSFVIGQILSALAVLGMFIAPHFKKKPQITLTMLISSSLFSASLFVLGAATGAWLCLVGALWTGFVYILERKQIKISRTMVFSALAIATAVWFFGAESWVDIFSLAGTYCMFIALFFKDEQLLRLLLVGNYMFWIIYTVFFWALVAAIGNIANLISTIAAIWRHRKARKQKGS